MKKKGLSHKVKRVLGAIGCLILALLVWLIVGFDDLSEITGSLSNLG